MLLLPYDTAPYFELLSSVKQFVDQTRNDVIAQMSCVLTH